MRFRNENAGACFKDILRDAKYNGTVYELEVAAEGWIGITLLSQQIMKS
jgi:hypothetical protein